MLAVLCLVSLVGLPVLAFKGVGFRGVYVAVALPAITIGILAVMTTGTAASAVTSTDAATQAGAEFLTVYGFAFAGWAFVTGFGAILGACLYRSKEA